MIDVNDGSGGLEDEDRRLLSPEEAINFHPAIKEADGNRFPYKLQSVRGNEVLLAHRQDLKNVLHKLSNASRK